MRYATPTIISTASVNRQIKNVDEANMQTLDNAGQKVEVVLFGLSLALNVALGHVLLTNRRAPTSSVETLIGHVMPPLRALDLEGRKVDISYQSDNRPTIIYVFSPMCKFCQNNAVSIASLAEQVSATFRIVGVSLVKQDVERFARERSMRFPVLTDVDPKVKDAFHMTGTPQTYLVGADGRLKKVWKGAFFGETRKNVEAFFGVHLTDSAS
jgi:peroxiredoxin